jgi:RNA polymerase sigma factor (sigma-70 family)
MDKKQEQHVLLWNSFKTGDWDAYTKLYHAYYRLLNNYGHKFTKDINLIEDAVHDLFVTLWANRNNLGNPLSVKNYLYKSIRNILLKKIKSASRIFHLEEDSESIPFVVSFDHQLISNEEEKRLQQTISAVINKLPPRQQEIIFLRFYEGLSYEDAADIMGIHVSSAYKLLYKALENVQQSLTCTGLGLLTLLLNILNDDPTNAHLQQATSGSLVFSLPQ